MNFLHRLVPPLAHRDLRRWAFLVNFFFLLIFLIILESPNVLLKTLEILPGKVVAKIGDFGLTSAASSRLQQELQTWQWMAPEAFLGENYTGDYFKWTVLSIFTFTLFKKRNMRFVFLRDGRLGNIYWLRRNPVRGVLQPQQEEKRAWSKIFFIILPLLLEF